MLHDLCGQSLKSLGRSIGYRQARRDLDAGREVLCSDGVLPWAAYARGVLADDWWQDPALQDAVNEWIEARFTDPAEPVPSAEDRLRAATASLIDTTQIERRISLVLLGGFASGEPWRWEDPCAQPCAQPARIPAT